MTLINSCSGLALEIVQRSNAPNFARRNLDPEYRANITREILRLSHEINGKPLESGGDPFKFLMENDRLAADLHRLGDKSATELRKCVIIVSGLSACYEMECRMLENNPAGLNRAEIERIVGSQYNRLLRQQQDSKALSASKGTVTANRGKGKNRRSHHKFDGAASITEKRYPRWRQQERKKETFCRWTGSEESRIWTNRVTQPR